MYIRVLRTSQKSGQRIRQMPVHKTDVLLDVLSIAVAHTTICPCGCWIAWSRRKAFALSCSFCIGTSTLQYCRAAQRHSYLLHHSHLVVCYGSTQASQYDMQIIIVPAHAKRAVLCTHAEGRFDHLPSRFPQPGQRKARCQPPTYCTYFDEGRFIQR